MNSEERFERQSRIRKIVVFVLLASLGIFLILLAALLIFRHPILNGYAKRKAERAFAQAVPGSELHLGKLNYSISANRLTTQSISITGTNLTAKAGRVSLAGVKWLRAAFGAGDTATLLAQANFEAADARLRWPQSNYGLSCSLLKMSVASSNFLAETIVLQPLLETEKFFDQSPYRTTRLKLSIGQCRVSGIHPADALRGKSFRAAALDITEARFEALVNREKPKKPFQKSPLMAHEALHKIPAPFRLDRVSITNSHITYSERMEAAGKAGDLAFSHLEMVASPLCNYGDKSATIRIDGQADLMGAGRLKINLSMPVHAHKLSLDYSGSLSPMNLEALNAFLEIPEKLRIKSGTADAAQFQITYSDGHATGEVRAAYQNLQIAVLDDETGKESGLGNRIMSFLANAIKIRNANQPKGNDPGKVGRVDYERQPDDSFLQVLWFALRGGVLDVISI